MNGDPDDWRPPKSTPADTTPGAMSPVEMQPVDPLPGAQAPPRVHRFSSTDLTFGPVGRVVATVVMLLPYWLFTHSILGIAGLVLWTPVFWRGMRDVWRRGDRVIDRRTASERGLHVPRPDDVPLVRTDYPGDGDESEPPRRW